MKSLGVAFLIFIIPVIVLMSMQTISGRATGAGYVRYYYGVLFLEVAGFYILGSAAAWFLTRP
jgi:hypothetical protein